MAIWRAQVELEAGSLLPEDKIVNTWHFEGSETATDLANIDDMLSDFYDGANPSGRLFGVYSNSGVTGKVKIKIFCLADPEPRIPRGEFLHTWSRGAGGGLPSEVALVMSYQGSEVAGEPQRRRRGRVYLGPFNAAQNTAGRPVQNLRQIIGEAASQLQAAAEASVTWQWVVYSRADVAGVEVVDGWIDNAWDTQRRRGLKMTDRLPWA